MKKKPGDELKVTDFADVLDTAYTEYGYTHALEHIIKKGFKGLDNMSKEEIQDSMKELQTIEAINEYLYTYCYLKWYEEHKPTSFLRGFDYNSEEEAEKYYKEYTREFYKDIDYDFHKSNRFNFVDQEKLMDLLESKRHDYNNQLMANYIYKANYKYKKELELNREKQKEITITSEEISQKLEDCVKEAIEKGLFYNAD